jgi:hypothetical protein
VDHGERRENKKESDIFNKGKKEADSFICGYFAWFGDSGCHPRPRLGTASILLGLRYHLAMWMLFLGHPAAIPIVQS